MTIGYLKSPGISQSMLKAFADNPQLFHETYILKIRDFPPPSKEMIWGRNIESFLRGDALEGITLIPRHVLDKNGHRKGNDWKQWKAAKLRDGVLEENLLNQREYDERFGALESIKQNIEAHKKARFLLLSDEGVWSKSFYWKCPLTDIGRKGEADRYFEERRWIVDLKCVNDPTPRKFAKHAEDFGYHIQLSTYIGAEFLIAGNSPACAGLIVAIRNSAPFDVHVYQMADSWLLTGRRWTEQYMAALKVAFESEQWKFPGHGEVLPLERPKWAEKDD